MRVSFVILHYNVFNMTILSVECLLAVLQKADIDVVIVDNASPNGSGNDLQTYFKDYQKVHVLLSERNLGFAQGNNMGYRWAKEHLNPDYIVVMNNDVIIRDKEFCKKLISLEGVEGILGPDILNKRGEHQNPYRYGIETVRELRKSIVLTRMKMIGVSLFYGLHKKKREQLSDNNDLHEKEKIHLHGACIIFTKDFIKTVEYAFYPDTFLYGEEDFLFLLAQKMCLKMSYEPLLKVEHMEDVSTETVNTGAKKKRLFEK